eukprot:4735237-Alexandrium_andersonii.AAC.1
MSGGAPEAPPDSKDERFALSEAAPQAPPLRPVLRLSRLHHRARLTILSSRCSRAVGRGRC